ncbi:hypothetical protein LMG9449_0593 [Lactococcus lactis subsp. lactis]|uniref:Uncharacterized protein n=1 Tax=Lactococcus lactis subsp. lactis TaxID=1360 RepID=A0A0V8E3Y6_LACLL|nr:hypothetical protein LMG9449_0593 [Lactococcus lactis subsp. lactis]
MDLKLLTKITILAVSENICSVSKKKTELISLFFIVFILISL